MAFMSKLIYLNSLKVLGMVVILGGVSGNAIALTPNTPNISRHLVADLPTVFPPANLPVNPRTTVKVPPLNRPEASVVPATPNPRVLPNNQAPATPNIPATRKIESTPPDASVPQIIEFGQPLPK
jgi:hypothetical protein